ncbi:hypothetical protein [Mycobacteroides saopaulense]|uniref:hypothetical protein n=1 Tax=Mycobacteroides saopaulense TaxID=1578165 RepID=UPI000B4D613D|nr:hypothetical protein [Mycobacteroides saopaulense]
MTSESDSWLNNFIKVIERLAAPAKEQIDYINGLDIPVDELALEFDSLYLVDRLSLTNEQLGYSNQIDRLLDDLSNDDDKGQWSREGLISDLRWGEIRRTADLLLASLRR